MIKANISQDIIRVQRPVRLKKGNKYTGEVKWEPCDKFGNDLKKKRLLKGFSKLDLGNAMSQVSTETKRDRVLEMLANIEELTDQEAERISNIYRNKVLTVENILNLYNIFLVLFGEKRAGDQITRFLKEKNVRLFSIF